MINNVILAGRFAGFNDDGKLLLKVSELKNHQIVKIDICDDIKIKVSEYVKNNDIIGIKGIVELDDINNIIIIASKLTFLSDKNPQE